MISVYASPFLPLTSRNPSAPAPPALLTTMNGLGESLCFSAMPAMSRAIWSAPPPVPAGTTNSMGFEGSHAATFALGANPMRTRPISHPAIRGRWHPMRVLLLEVVGRGSTAARRYVLRSSWDSATLRRPGLPSSPTAGSPLIRLLAGALLPERDHSRDFPLVPHLVHLALEVPEVLLREVSEASLLEQVLADRLAWPALHDGLGFAVVPHDAVLDLVERKDAGLDRELAEFVREHGIVVPALGTGIEGVDERRPTDGERASHLVHHLDRVRRADRGHVAALRVPRRQHARRVLLPARVDDPLDRSGRAEGRVGAVRRRA